MSHNKINILLVLVGETAIDIMNLFAMFKTPNTFLRESHKTRKIPIRKEHSDPQSCQKVFVPLPEQLWFSKRTEVYG